MITRTSRGTKRFVAAAAAVAMIGSTLAISTSAMAGPGVTAPTPARNQGVDRYATAADVADDVADKINITIVNGEDFPDGLASAIYGKSVLLVKKDVIPAATSTWLETNKATVASIKVVGGESVVSSAVFEGLGTWGAVTRVAGTNRYLTAQAVAEDSFPTPTKIILATGEDFPDALAAGPLAVQQSAPIILNNGAALRADVVAYLNANPTISQVYIVGGETAVSAAIEAELKGPRGLTVKRLGGATRAATAVAIATEYGNVAKVTFVNGQGFADALSASAIAAGTTSPILMVNASSIPAETAGWHTANCATITDIRAVGGLAVVNATVLAGAVAAATCAPVAITSSTLTVSDVKQRTITLTDGVPTANEVTLTGVASGALANAWTVSFAAGAVAGAVVNAVANTIVYTDTFGTAALTQTQFITNFNGSTAGAHFVASLNTGGTGTTVFAATASVDVDTTGSADYTVVVTFNQAVEGTAPGAAPAAADVSLDSNQNPAIASAFGGVPSITAPVTYGAVGQTSVTYKWNDASIAVSLSSGSIKFAATSVVPKVTTVANTAVLVGAF